MVLLILLPLKHMGHSSSMLHTKVAAANPNLALSLSVYTHTAHLTLCIDQISHPSIFCRLPLKHAGKVMCYGSGLQQQEVGTYCSQLSEKESRSARVKILTHVCFRYKSSSEAHCTNFLYFPEKELKCFPARKMYAMNDILGANVWRLLTCRVFLWSLHA